MMKPLLRIDSLFIYLLITNILFFIWQIVTPLLTQVDYNLLHLLAGRHFIIPWPVIRSLIEFGLIQFLLIFSFSFVTWLSARLLAALFSLNAQKTFIVGFSLFIGLSLFILIANQVFYPNSFWGHLMASILPLGCSKFLLIIGYLMLGTILCLISFSVIKHISNLKRVALAICAISLIGGLGINSYSHRTSIQSTNATQPNIIIIGLDAVRPDRLGYYGYSNKTPHLDQFLSNSVKFSESLTPLARTFPAWISLLTGQYPKHTQVRDDLVDIAHLNVSKTLPNLLKAAGYYTIYATDDTRFNQTTEALGFDETIQVEPGLTDFLLGAVNDFPLSNLLLNTQMGEWLFPYNFANRADSETYYPQAFIHKLNVHLPRLQNKPLFLAVHFCLTHWPYYWANTSPTLSRAPSSDLYDLAVQKIDEQFFQFLNILKSRGWLQNAVVIVLSDHGETFGLAGDRSIKESGYIKGSASQPHILEKIQALDTRQGDLVSAAGHGTDVLSFYQYRTLLAFQSFGTLHFVPHTVKGLVSLLDIKPTLLDLIGVPFKHSSEDGLSLRSYLQTAKEQVPNRPLFVEIGFTPKTIQSTDISPIAVVKEVIDAIQINPQTSRVELRPEQITQLLKTRERAVYYRNWILAFYPSAKGGWYAILTNRLTGQWTDDLEIPFAQQSPVQFMLTAFKKYYGDEVKI